MKKRGSTVILIGVFAAGLFLLLYPTVSDYWNSLHQSRAVSGYIDDVRRLDKEKTTRMWEAAEEYNRRLLSNVNRFAPSKEEHEEYTGLLDVSGTGIMAYIEIPEINCRLPVYHGTDEGVLQEGAGHIEGSSLPVGGVSTHCVLSGHSGLPSAKLLTELDRLSEGDAFVIQTLGRRLTYEVDQIRVVEPEETEDLKIVNGKDYCTLVTCTPYGVNTHRLLVRGKRVSGQEAVNIGEQTEKGGRAGTYWNLSVAAALLLAAILAVMLIKYRKKP